MNLKEYISHVRDRKYMSGVERDKLRIKFSNEVFTPTELVLIILDQLEMEDPSIFSDPEKQWLDNFCGDGQFLSEVIIRKIERSGCSLKKALETTFGTDIMEDNIIECRYRLAGPNPSKDILEIVNKNIVCTDSFEWDYNNWCPFNNHKAKPLF